jgi:metal-responsive CopG/Arc/MetJ family transcriptional regulator
MQITGGRRMSHRRRSADPTKSIAITIPVSVLNILDARLSYESSRSAWITKAVKDRLNGIKSESLTLNEMQTKQIMVALTGRQDLPSHVRAIIVDWINQNQT